MVNENTYAEIEVLPGLPGMRQRRSMYIGSTGILNEGHAPSALTQLSQEILSNSLDERVEGYGHKISIKINKDNSMSITDQGRGMPKGPGTSFEDVISASTIPHASGKFGANGYKTSGVAGMNGIGVKITNAVSKYLKIKAISRSTVLKDGKKVLTGGLEAYEITFNGEKVIDQKIIASWKKNEIELVENANNLFRVKETNDLIQPGTTIEFLPDDGPVSEKNPLPVFESTEWTNNDLFTRFEGSAFLNAGLLIEFTDLRPDEPIIKSWRYENGLADYVKVLAENQTLLANVKDPIVINGDYDDGKYNFSLNAALLFTDDISTNLVSFANGVPTKDGGPHVDGFLQALTKSFNDFVKDKKIIKSGALSQSDILEGLVGTFELKIPSEIAEFDGQTKEKLSTVQAKQATYNIVLEEMTNWIYDRPNIAKKIIEKMLESKAARESAIKARQEAKKARQSKSGTKLSISSKLKAASSKKPEEKELFITEGDSASNIKRDQKTQAIFPIRGKIINAHKNNLSKLLDNQEVSTIAAVIGAGIGPAFEFDEMQYHKIIITTDQDDDGSHISMLLIGLFYKYFKPIIEAGRLYKVQTPLYKVVTYDKKGQKNIEMFYSEREMANYKGDLSKADVQRYKGLGEMNEEEAYDSITNKEKRRLLQISIDDAESAKKMITILLSEDASLRKAFVDTYIDFDKMYEEQFL